MKSFMAFYGAGDHGGGATKENIRSIEELKSEKGAPKVFSVPLNDTLRRSVKRKM